MNFLGIDIGGTKMALSIGNERGEILADQRFPTDPENALKTLAQAVVVAEELIAKAGLTVNQIDAIGISDIHLHCFKTNWRGPGSIGNNDAMTGRFE